MTTDEHPETDDTTGHGRRSPADSGSGGTEDVTGHMPRIRGNIVHDATQEADDTTGHMPLRKVVDDVTDEVTGHGYRRMADAETDDTTGHMPYRRSADAETDETDDDVSGHGRRAPSDGIEDDGWPIEGRSPR